MGSAESDFQGSRRFRVLRRLGEGGMGVVYEALDEERQTRVALKMLRTLSADAILYFKQEFRALQDVHHPNLVGLGELVEEGGQWFFTMELVDGTDFMSHVRPDAGAPQDHDAVTQQLAGASSQARSQRTSTANLDTRRLRAALGQLAQGLSALHAAGKVHRDIKPSNIRVTEDGRVVLLDFGLVTDAVRDHSWTEVKMVGTPDYMAPEQAAGKVAAPAADWYSVGVLLFQALTGRLPYLGATLEVLMNKQRFAPAAPAEIADGVPEDLNALCVELLRFDPALRPSGQSLLVRLGCDPAGSAAQPSSSSATQRAPFVGRGWELAALEEAFHKVLKGNAVTMLVQGESGVGKSALVRHFTEGLGEHNQVVLTGRCYERETVPYKAVDGLVDALSRHMMRMPEAEAAALLPLHADLLGQVFQVLRRVKPIAQAPRERHAALDPQEQRSRVFAALRELLLRLSQRRPLVLVIDDLQWADADSMALLSAVLRPPEAPALLLVATVRKTASTSALAATLAGDVRTLELGGLGVDEAAELVSLLLKRAPGRAAGLAVQMASIAAEAKGHPLYIDELVRHSLEVGSGMAEEMHLDAALWSRVTRLEPRTRQLLECVAVAGGPLLQETASNAAKLESAELQKRLAQLRVANLVRTTGARPDDAIESYHDRVREAVLANLDGPAQRSWHESLALALEAGRADPEAMATHWFGAGDTGKAAAYSAQAARKASQALAFDHAARLFRWSLELRPAGDPAALPLRVALGEALANAGRGKEAADAYLVAAESANAAEALEHRRRAAEQLLRSGHIDEGLAAVRVVLGALGMTMPETPRRALASLLWRRARLRLRGLSFQERDESQIAAEDLRRIDACWSISVGLGLVDTIRGTDFQARHLLLALDAGEPHRIARALAMEIGYSATLGRVTRHTARLMKTAEGMAQRLGDPIFLGWQIGAEGIAAYLQGRWKTARELCERAVPLFRSSPGADWELATAHAFSLWSLHYLGELHELSRRVPLRLLDVEQRGDLYTATNLRVGSSNLAWLAGDDLEGARREARTASEQWTPRSFHLQHFWTTFAEAQIDLYAGQHGAALERVNEHWRSLRSSLLLRVQLVRIEAVELLARVSLAAAKGSSNQAALLHKAEQGARALAAERLAWSTPLAHLLRAGIASCRGETEAALRLLGLAEQGFDAADMAFYAAATRLRRGQLLGGQEGQELAAAAQRWAASQRIKNPTRLLAMLTPSFD